MFINSEHLVLLNAVVSALRETLRVSTGEPVDVSLLAEPGQADARIRIAVRPRPLTLDVEIKKSAFGPASATVVAARTHKPATTLVATPRLTPGVISTCRSVGLNCADADGNVLLRWDNSLIDIEGRPPAASKSFVVHGPGSLVTSRAGLQLVFVLLAFPDLVNGTVRALADAAGVAIGSVSNVLRELQDTGQLRDVRHARRLTDPEKLIDTFVDGYRRRLAPRLSLGTFSAIEPRWWTDASPTIRQAGGQWGGESALWVERRIRPARGVVYLDELTPRLISGLRMRKDSAPTANADFRRRFWRVEAATGRPTVPKLLVYADLLDDGDPRLFEAAAELRRTDPELSNHG